MSLRPVGRESLDDAAVRNRTAAAAVDDGAQLAAKSAKVRNLPVDVGQVFPRDRVGGAA